MYRGMYGGIINDLIQNQGYQAENCLVLSYCQPSSAVIRRAIGEDPLVPMEIYKHISLLTEKQYKCGNSQPDVCGVKRVDRL